MKQNHKHLHFNRYILGTLLVAVIIAIAGIAVNLSRSTANATSPAKETSSKIKSKFSFTGTSGWRQGPANETSMALFHNADSCFVSFEYKTGTVNIDDELSKNQQDLSSTGYNSASTAVLTTSLQTKTETKQYQLHQYSASGSPNGHDVMGGQEFGYVQLANGYVKVIGYCDTVEQLSATIPALQAVVLN